MLTTIPILSFFIFSATYPLCFLFSADDPLKNSFHRFHLGTPNLIAGLAVIWLWNLDVSGYLQWMALIWLAFFFAVDFFYWNRTHVSILYTTCISLAGLLVYTRLHSELLTADAWSIGVSILAGLIVSVAFYAMNLGHWYLNVHGLSLHHLKRTCWIFACLLGVRLLINTVMLFSSDVIYQGEPFRLWNFSVSTVDGCLLWIAILFGTVLPLGCMFFVKGTLSLKNTQATTGILYVLLSAVLLGDLTYKYFLVRYQLAL